MISYLNICKISYLCIEIFLIKFSAHATIFCCLRKIAISSRRSQTYFSTHPCASHCSFVCSSNAWWSASMSAHNDENKHWFNGLALIKFTHLQRNLLLRAVLVIFFLQQEPLCGENNVSIQHLAVFLWFFLWLQTWSQYMLLYDQCKFQHISPMEWSTL